MNDKTNNRISTERVCKLINDDCLKIMPIFPDNAVDLTLTDIPYNAVNRKDNGLRKLNKENADILTFDLISFLNQIYRVTKGTIIIFCGKEQISTIYKFFSEKQKQSKGTVRQLIWQKTNPSPMNGQYIYLSGIENGVWFKKRGAVFNAKCKNTVFKYPCGTSKFHPTEKNHDLLKELILDNSNENQMVFDPCMGSGTTGVAALKNNRNFIGIELDKSYYDVAVKRINNKDINNYEQTKNTNSST